MASSQFLVRIVLVLSYFQNVLSLSSHWPTFDPYGSLNGLNRFTLTARNGEALLWSDVFVHKLREFVVAVRTPDVLRGLEDPICMAHLAHIGSQLDQWINNGTLPNTFILQLLDAWGKLPSGILRGHLTDLGDFEECIHAKGYLNSSVYPRNVKGSYRIGLVRFTSEDEDDEMPGPYPNRTSGGAVSPEELLSYMNSNFGVFMRMLPRLGTCLPDSCSLPDARQFVNNVMKATFGDEIHLTLFPRITAEKPLNVAAVYFIIGVAILLSVCLIGTILDLLTLNFERHQDGKVVRGTVAVFKSFSLYTNTLSFLNAHDVKSRMTSLEGMEFISFAWIFLAHSWGLLSFQVTCNAIDLRESIRSGWGMMIIQNASVAYDSLFLINGTIAGYNILEQLEKNRKLNPLPLYCWKYFLITPPVLLIAAFGATVLPQVGTGPFWYLIEAEASNCLSNWWHNILHMQSFVEYHDVDDPFNFMCHSNSWYVADDMVYFLLAPIFVYVLWRWRKLGFCCMLLWMFQPVIQTAVLSDFKHLTPTYIPSLPGSRLNAYFYNLYNKPWIRSTPYTVGLLLSYLLYRYGRRDTDLKSHYKPSGLIITFGWMASTVIALAVIVGPIRFFDMAHVEEAEGSPIAILYGSCHRLAWAIAIAWVIFACVNEYPRWVNRILSWQPLVSLGKLSLCMHLCAQYIQAIHRISKYEPVRYSATNFIEGYVFQLALSVLAGFILYVTLQAPVERLQELVGRQRSDDQNDVVRNTY